jgi:hypothetical protein
MIVIIKYFKVLLIFIFISCTAQKKEIGKDDNTNKEVLGRYVKENYPFTNPNSEEILILKNNIVKYNLSLELYGTHEFIGSWKVKDDTLKYLQLIKKEILKLNTTIKNRKALA